MSEVPKVLVLGPITPTDNSNSLSYAKLAKASSDHSRYDSARFHSFLESENDSLDEEEAARQLAMQYLLMTAYKATESPEIENKELWSQRYTILSSEIYGTPEATILKEIIRNEYLRLLELVGDDNVDQELLMKVLRVYETSDVSQEQLKGIEESRDADPASRATRSYLTSKYSFALEVFDGEDGYLNAPEEIASKFSQAIAKLSEIDPGWSEWKIILSPDKDSLSVTGSKKTITIGLNRAPATNESLRGLFAHEVLVHALRALNGSKDDAQLGSGLAGYLDFEEGLGTYFEYAITGEIPQKNTDRYFDIALAMGLIGEPMSRGAMLEFVTMREILRSQANGEEINEEHIGKKVHAHVNRIYRGTTADSIETSGVFTKDIAYHKGFVEVQNYINDRLLRGDNIEDIIEFLLSGKFDPTNSKHIEYLKTLNKV